ncbi:MAG: hypothetical protein QXV06_05020, partial [Ignisphaera sp.]
ELIELEVVDIHQHLNPSQLTAKSFEDIIFYHYIVTELASAGMNREEFEKAQHKDKLLIALPFFKYVKNTTTFWCLRQILKNLYGVDVKSIDESNWKEVLEAIEDKQRGSGWAYEVLKKFCKVKKSFLTINPLEPLPQYDKDIFTGALRVEHIIQGISKDSIQKIEQFVGVEINDVNSLDNAIESLFKKLVNDIVTITVPIQPDEIFGLPHKSEITLYIRDLKKRGMVNDEERMAIASYVLHKLLTLCSQYKKAVQFMLGVKKPLPMAAPPDYAITIYNPNQILNLVKIFAMYPDVKFDILLADSTLSHQLSVVAKNYPNVSLSGYWWYSMYPEIIRNYLKLRLQILPYNKIGGFFSDAYVVEWVYGKVSLVKKELAYVLSEMIYLNYVDKESALELAKYILSE